MKRKYYIPYLYVTLPMVGIMTALLFLIGRTENHAAIALCILAGLVWMPEALLWKLLLRHWCKAPYWRTAEHVSVIHICLLLTSVCIVYGSILSDVWSGGVSFIPALIPYAIGLAYLYFFAQRNETPYLQKKNYRNERLPLRPFLRSYLPAFLWGDLGAIALTGALLWLSAQFPVIAEYDRAAFIVVAILIFTAVDRLWKQQRIYRMFGGRSYPTGMLVISILALMATPFLCFVGEYGVAVVAQVVAGGCYLHANYLYEQESLNLRNH